MDTTVYYPFNRTFGHYYESGIPLAGKRARAFIEERNKCKGGVWELHTSEQYLQWYDTVGKHKEYLKYGQRGQ